MSATTETKTDLPGDHSAGRRAAAGGQNRPPHYLGAVQATGECGVE